MYIRWKDKPRSPTWRHESATLHVAYLVQSKRIEGKPRQRTQYLACIQDWQIEMISHRANFWQKALTSLQCAQISSEQRQVLEANLAKRVPRPSDQEIEEARRCAEAAKRYLAQRIKSRV